MEGQAVTFKLPTYCYSCGAYLMGGATEHKPGCEVQALIDESLAEAERERRNING
jgi:hypothetical protein